MLVRVVEQQKERKAREWEPEPLHLPLELPLVDRNPASDGNEPDDLGDLDDPDDTIDDAGSYRPIVIDLA